MQVMKLLLGRFNAGGGIESVSSPQVDLPVPLRVTANEVPNNIPGICGREVIRSTQSLSL